MSPLDMWRREVRALLPRGFLRRAQEGDALFISDLPRHMENAEGVLAALAGVGFRAEEKNGLLYIDGTEEKYRALAERFPPCPPPDFDGQNAYLYSLALRLLRHSVPPGEQPPALLRLTLKALDAGDESGLARELPPLLAACQRKKKPLPTAAGQMILDYLSDKEGSPC